MTRWKGESTDADESTGSSGDFTPAPRGFYKIQVANYTDGMTKKIPPRPMVTLECEIAEGDYLGKKVWVTVTQIKKGDKGYGIMVRNLHAFGLGLDGTFDFESSEFQGQTATALLGIKPYTKVKDGRTYTNDVNYVEDLYTLNTPPPEELPPAPPAPRQQEVKTASDVNKLKTVENGKPTLEEVDF